MDPTDTNSALDPLQQIYPYWLSLVDYLKIKAFVELTLMDSVRTGIQQVFLSFKHMHIYPLTLFSS